MVPKKKPATPAEAVTAAAESVTEVATDIAEAAKITAANNALKFRIWEAIIGGIVAIFLGYIQLQTLLAVNGAVTTSTQNAKQIQEVQVTTEKTHKLVNSQSLVAAELHAVTAKRLAEITKDPRDLASAELAEKVVVEQREKQARAEAEEKLKGK